MLDVLKHLIAQPEGRRREYKETLPAAEELAKTIIAFSNDASGELFIGIKDKPRKVTGVPEEELLPTEERIANIITDLCQPVILPGISFLNLDGPTVIRVKVYRGSQAPYYLKHKGKEKGVYIRVGSSNRLAPPEIVQELERMSRNISFDSLPVVDLAPEPFILNKFAKKYQERTGEPLNDAALRKLQLIKTANDQAYYTHAALLLADPEVKSRYFPYSKVECARFKGTSSETFLDQETIEDNIAVHADEVIHFIRRNIAHGATINGIYREDRWEYPLAAVREAVINAIIHRDYALQGKDIKVAIYEDMLEITSPGAAPPSIDISGDLPVGQSEIRNLVLAPIFKRLGLIEQWGTGFKKIKEALAEYPEIELRINEPGMAFQMQFVKKDYQPTESEAKTGLGWDQVGTKLGLSREQVIKLMEVCSAEIPIVQLMQQFDWKNRTKFRAKFLTPMIQYGWLRMTIPEKPNSPNQRYVITAKGRELLRTLREENGTETV